MSLPIKIPLPLKGVNRNFARSDQPGDTAWDALNVLPYDRHGRLRIGQRPGTLRQYAAALPSGADLVTSLFQTTRALDPASIVANTSLLLRDFTGEALDTFVDTMDGGSTWRAGVNVSTELYNAADGIASSGRPRIFTSPTRVSCTGAAISAFSTYLPTLVIGSSYVLRSSVRINTAPSALVARIDKGFSSSVCVILRVTSALIEIRRQTTASASTQVSTFTFSTPFTANSTQLIELRVNGDVFTGWVGGVQYVSGTVTNAQVPTSQVGVAFGIAFAQASATGSYSFEVLTGTSPASFRETSIIATANQNIYLGDLTTLPIATGGTGVVAGNALPQWVFSAGFAYAVDGVSILRVNLTNKSVVAYTASAGTAPVGCRLATMWRDRLVLAAPDGNSQNFFFSRVGTHTDWDYSQTDPAAAFAGNASISGRIGEPITALIPFSDDVLLIGGDKNLWAIRGDPADGGSIDLVSNAVGVLGARSWTKSPDGTVYFIGSGGLYRISPGGQPESVGNTQYLQYLAATNIGNQYLTLVWDNDRQGMYIFVTPVNTGTATHLWFDARTGGLWPLRFPDSHGPISALVYDGDLADDRVVLMGGRTGLIQRVKLVNRLDDGATISASLTIGPFQPVEHAEDAIVTALDVTGGEPLAAFHAATVFNMQWALRGGKSAFEVTEGVPRRIAGGVFPMGGRQLSRVTRVRGGWFALHFSNAVASEYFSLEQITVRAIPAGRQR